MKTDRSKSLFLSNPADAWQDPEYNSRRAKMNDTELDATDAIESYSVRCNKTHINLSVLYIQLWQEWKDDMKTVTTKHNKMESLALFTEWVNRQ